MTKFTAPSPHVLNLPVFIVSKRLIAIDEESVPTGYSIATIRRPSVTTQTMLHPIKLIKGVSVVDFPLLSFTTAILCLI